ncbi:MAG: hypothetical protein GXY58_05610 [Planctomycetaceae bacterium]|nr:hypothetical protein [Planctomycetaceae bacterium]
MARTQKMVLSIVLFAALCAVPVVSRACDGYCARSWLSAPGFGSSGSLYGLGHVPVPPYFALHPPVYYGERYYRSYGESPFARPDYSSRPQRVHVQAQVIINPFVAQLATTPAAPELEPAEVQPPVDQVTSGPQMIINPFYVAEPKVAYGK